MASLTDLPAPLQSRDWHWAERQLRKVATTKTAPAEVFYNVAKVLEEAGKLGQRLTWLKRAVAKRTD
ncbi:MAG: hypothetical protein AAFW87_11175 [Pseudomonadota bacterium]